MTVGHYTNGEWAAGIDHLIYGWGFFVVIAYCNFLVGEKLSKIEAKYDWMQNDSQKIKLDKVYKPYSLEPVHTIFHKKYFPATIFALFASVGLSTHLDRLEVTGTNPHKVLHHISPFPVQSQWQSILPKDKDGFQGKNFHIDEYVDPETFIRYGTVFYPFQNAQNEAVSQNNKFHNEKAWLLLGKKDVMVNNIPFIAEISGLLGHHKRITLYNYYIGSQHVDYETSALSVKLDLLNSVLATGKTAGGIFYVQMDVPHHLSLDDAIALLQEKGIGKE